MDQNSSQIKLISENASDSNNSKSNAILSANSTDKLITLAKSKLGNSYSPAKAGPDHFDCSGFVYYLFKTNDIAIPHSSLEQSKAEKQLNREEIQISSSFSKFFYINALCKNLFHDHSADIIDHGSVMVLVHHSYQNIFQSAAV